MPHQLWSDRNWQEASDEAIVAALQDAPPFIDPQDMGWIKKHKSNCIVTYQQLFYGGKTPQAIARIRDLRIS